MRLLVALALLAGLAAGATCGDWIVESPSEDCDPPSTVCCDAACKFVAASAGLFCYTGAWTCGAGSCQREQQRQTCDGLSSSCVAPLTTASQNCLAGTSCNPATGLCTAASATISCGSSGAACLTNTSLQTGFFGCNGAGVCNTGTVVATATTSPCTGGENSICVGAACVSRCGNGVDDDRDGLSDSCDPDCTGVAACVAGACCRTSGADVGCVFAATQTCATGAWTCADSCSRYRTNTNCSGSSSTCSGAMFNETSTCGAGTVCQAGACVPVSASAFCSASGSCTGQATAISYYGCAGPSAGTQCAAGTPSLVVLAGPVCEGRENSSCVAGACVDGCGAGADTDGDGFFDECDADCGGLQCTVGACCERAVGARRRGCVSSASTVCAAAPNTPVPSCVSACSALAAVSLCPGNATDCSGAQLVDYTFACLAGDVCSNTTGFCAPVSASLSCTPASTSCVTTTLARTTSNACDGAGGCLGTATAFEVSCAGTEASICLSGARLGSNGTADGCASACGNRVDDDADGQVDCADSDCECTGLLPAPSSSSGSLVHNRTFLIVLTLVILFVLCCALFLLIVAACYARADRKENTGAGSIAKSKAANAPALLLVDHSSATNPLYDEPPHAVAGNGDSLSHSVFFDDESRTLASPGVSAIALEPQSERARARAEPVARTEPGLTPDSSRTWDSRHIESNVSQPRLIDEDESGARVPVHTHVRRTTKHPVRDVGYYTYDTVL